MATEFLREKINMLNNNLQNEELQILYQQLLVIAAMESTGDKQVDDTLKSQAQNAKAVTLACQKRSRTFRAKLAELNAELEASQPAS